MAINKKAEGSHGAGGDRGAEDPRPRAPGHAALDDALPVGTADLPGRERSTPAGRALPRRAGGLGTPHPGAGTSAGWIGLAGKLLDWGLIIGALVATTVLVAGARFGTAYVAAALLASMLFVLVAETVGLYRPWRGDESVTRQFLVICATWAGIVFVLLLSAFGLHSSTEYARAAILPWLLITPVLLGGWRLAAKYLFRRVLSEASQTRKALVWGSGELGTEIARTIESAPMSGLQLVAYIEDRDFHPGPYLISPPGEPDFTLIERLELMAKRGDFDVIYIALPAAAKSRIASLIERLGDTTVSIFIVPDFFTTSLLNGQWSTLQGIPVINIVDTPFWGVDGLVKRIEDIVLSSAILAVISIPMLAIAAAVKLSSPGPVFFRQRRYGYDGAEISVLKFRSMTVCEDGDTVTQARKDDQRVTRVGAFLRRTSLDELPQFINVLRGDMSIVGPRPHAVAHNELYRTQIQGYMLRHKVKPGITGWAQINGWRGETEDLYKMEQRVEHDLWYIRNWSLPLDIKIVLLTIVRGFSGKHVY